MCVSGNACADSDCIYPGVSFALGPYRSSMFRDFFVDHMAAHTILTVGRLGGHDSRNRSGLKIPSTQFLDPLQSLVLREILPLALSSRRTLTPGGGAIPGSQPLPRGMAGSRARAAPPGIGAFASCWGIVRVSFRVSFRAGTNLEAGRPLVGMECSKKVSFPSGPLSFLRVRGDPGD